MTKLESTKIPVPKPPEKYKPTVLRPPPGQAFLAVSFIGKTLWYAGPASAISQNARDIEPILSWGGEHAYEIPRQEVLLEGFEPYTGGHEPLKSIKWPEPPKPAPPPKPRQLKDYREEELVSAFEQAIKKLDEEEDSEEYQKAVRELNAEMLRRLKLATKSVKKAVRRKNAKKAR